MFSNKSLERVFAHVMVTTATYHIWKEHNSRAHGKPKLSREQRWMLIDIESKIILLKSKKKVKRQTKIRYLSEWWDREGGSKNIENYLHYPRIKRVQIEPQSNSASKHHRDYAPTSRSTGLKYDNYSVNLFTSANYNNLGNKRNIFPN